jgi:AraC-like DNA-binding protein/quercetin dioxygenase-like cupin family protein
MSLERIITEAVDEAERRQGQIHSLKKLFDHPKINSEFHQYPDGSCHFDDLITAMCFVTKEASPVLTILFGNSFTYKLQAWRVRFEGEFLTPRYKHNYVELTYVIEGRYHQRVEGRDETLNQGEIFLIGRNTPHGKYFYQQNAKVLFLGISNAFFDKSGPLETGDPEGQRFLREMILNQDEKYHFVRFTPQKSESIIPRLFEAIVAELKRHEPGTRYLVMGYEAHVQGRQPAARRQFEDVKQYLGGHYRETSLEELVSVFGHTADYFNRLIKRHTGMKYSRFLQDIRLEKAKILLKTTQFTIEDIARQVGYENQTYFYRIFHEKFHAKPGGLRQSQPAILEDGIPNFTVQEGSD